MFSTYYLSFSYKSITSDCQSFTKDGCYFSPGILLMLLALDLLSSHQYKIQSLSGHTAINLSKALWVGNNEQVFTALHLVLQFNLIWYGGFDLIRNSGGTGRKSLQSNHLRIEENILSVALLHLPPSEGAEAEVITSQERRWILNTGMSKN